MSRKIRRMHTIYPFGVGALKEIAGESFIACDISRWGVRGTRLLGVDRLLRGFGVSELRTAEAGKNSQPLSFYRFPEWHFCEVKNCRALRQATTEEQEDAPQCTGRNGVFHKRRMMKPIRYVQVCRKGHIQEIDWNFWVHSAGSKCRSRDHLKLVPDAGSQQVRVVCASCETSRPITGQVGTGDKCRGRHPWVRLDAAEPCDQFVVGTQRGAGNVWFPLGDSGIVIPPDSDYDDRRLLFQKIREDKNFQNLCAAPNSPMAENHRRLLKARYNVSNADIEKCISSGIAVEVDRSPDTDGKAPLLREEEWQALTSEVDTPDPRSDFVIESVPRDSIDFSRTEFTEVPKWIESVTLVRRLREIRMLKGFTRVLPIGSFTDVSNSSDAVQLVPAGLGGETWRPAIEVFGEGIFLSISESEISKWESEARVVAETRTIEIAVEQHLMSSRFSQLVNSRYLLLHSLAHALIREISFDCGYPASSLRERIYCSTRTNESLPMAGILIYTADADGEGSMGGLVAQGEHDRILPLVERAIKSTAWCSLDPVCGETRSSGGLNYGSCHACSLLPETSCENSNALLHRGFISPDSDVSFFREDY
jgi:hypothetical protein